MNWGRVILFLISTVFKLGCLYLIHHTVYLLGYGENFLISNLNSYSIELTEEQGTRSFRYLPKKLTYFAHFSDATNGRWFNAIEKDGNTLILENIDIFSVDVTSSSNAEGMKSYKILHENGSNHHVLEEIEEVFHTSIAYYLIYHCWRWFLILGVFILASVWVKHIFSYANKTSAILIFFCYTLWIVNHLFFG